MRLCSIWSGLIRNQLFAVLLLALLCGQAAAQESAADSTARSDEDRRSRFLFRERVWHNYEDLTLGAWMSTQFGRSFRPELGVVYGRADMGEWGGVVRGVFAAYEWSPHNATRAVRAGVFGNSTFVILGVNAAASVVRFQHEDASAWAVRPELGLGAYRLYFNYGYNFLLSKRISGVNRGHFTITFYLPLLPSKVDVRGPRWIE